MEEINLRMSQLDTFSLAAEKLRENSILTDVTLMCEGKEFQAHRFILGAGSPYFRIMFTGDMRESTSSKVEIQGIQHEAMTVILQFLYLKEIENLSSLDILKSVISASHMLQLHQLHHYCCNKYLSSLSINYFNEMWNIAELFDNDSMIRFIISFLAKHFSEIMRSDDFLLLNAVRLEKLIAICKFEVVTSTDLLAESILNWYKYNIHDEHSEDDFLKLLDAVDLNCLSNECLTLLCNDMVIKTSARLLLLILPITTHRLSSKLKKVVDISNLHIYFFGKTDDLSVVQSFHYSKKEWSPIVKLPFMIRDDAAIVYYNEYVYFIGGKRNVSRRPTSKVDKFGLLLTSMIKSATAMNQARCNAGAVAYNGKIYVVGGSDAGTTTFLNMDLSRMLEIYDIQTDTWKLGSSTRYFYNSPQVVELNDRIFVLNSNTCSSVECYNPATDQWSVLSSPSMLLPAGDTWVTPCEGKLYTFHVKREFQVLVYDLESGRWSIDEAGYVQHQIRGIWSMCSKQCSLPFIFILDCQNQLHKFEPRTKSWQICGSLQAKLTLVHGVVTG